MFERYVCRTPSAPVTIEIPIIPATSADSSLTSLCGIASSSTLRSRNGEAMPRSDEIPIRTRTIVSRLRYRLKRPATRRRFARRTAGSEVGDVLGRAGGAVRRVGDDGVVVLLHLDPERVARARKHVPGRDHHEMAVLAEEPGRLLEAPIRIEPVESRERHDGVEARPLGLPDVEVADDDIWERSEEHTSELQSQS